MLLSLTELSATSLPYPHTAYLFALANKTHSLPLNLNFVAQPGSDLRTSVPRVVLAGLVLPRSRSEPLSQD